MRLTFGRGLAKALPGLSKVFHFLEEDENESLVRFLPGVPADHQMLLSLPYHLVTISLCHQSPAFHDWICRSYSSSYGSTGSIVALGLPPLPLCFLHSSDCSACMFNLGLVCLTTLAVWLLRCCIYCCCCYSLQASLIEANGELKVFIDQNLSPGKGKGACSGNVSLLMIMWCVNALLTAGPTATL